MKIKIILLSLLLSVGIVTFCSQTPEPIESSSTSSDTSSSSSSTGNSDNSGDYPFDPPMYIPHIVLSAIRHI